MDIYRLVRMRLPMTGSSQAFLVSPFLDRECLRSKPVPANAVFYSTTFKLISASASELPPTQML